jgi:hypothetical protein
VMIIFDLYNNFNPSFEVVGLLLCFSLMSINLNGKIELVKRVKYLAYLGLMIIYAYQFLFLNANYYNGMLIQIILLSTYFPLIGLSLFIDGFRKVKWEVDFENKIILLLLIILFCPGILA